MTGHTEISIHSNSIQSCRVCKSTVLEQVLDLGIQPLANELLQSTSEANNYFPLILTRCNSCGTLQLTETVSPSLLFDSYVWVTGTSDTAVAYSKSFCKSVLDQLHTINCQPKILEIASNDGTFLKQFKQNNCFVIGVDPARNIADEATKKGIPTIPEYFSLKQAQSIVSKYGEFDVVFARNVIPHVADVFDVVSGIHSSLSEDGIGVIEFHRADIILQELHYDSIYHEHVCYHSISSLNRILLEFGLHIYHVEKSPISGGSYVLYFSKLKRTITPQLAEEIAFENQLNITSQSSWNTFAIKSIENKNKIVELVNSMISQGKKVVGYGASARSSTVLNFCNLDSSKIDYIVDKSHYKHNKFSPGMNIPIVPPSHITSSSHKPDAIIILAWNFKSEILEWLKSVDWHGEIILPLPGSPTLIDF